MISEQKYKESAKKLGVSVASLKAVAEVESGGKGFLSSGEPVILFEPHVFWRQLKAKGIDPMKILAQQPGYSDILYPKWGTKPYGKSSQQHLRLQRAAQISRSAALESASWGMFQILGLHWSTLGYLSLQQFVNDAYRSEDSHMEMLVRFIETKQLAKYLKNEDWAGFALRYNGKGYKKNKYDEKLEAAFNKYNK